MSSADGSEVSFHVESDESDDFENLVYRDEDKVLELKNLRVKVNKKLKEERRNFLERVYPLIGRWRDPLPNLRDIFRPEEINWILWDAIDYFEDEGNIAGEVIIGFIARTGYKDEPDVDEDGKPLSRRNTPLHHAAEHKCRGLVHELFKIFDRFDVNYTNEDGYTHFHVACEFGFHDVVRKFLEQGQDPDLIVTKTGDSPLHFAMQHERNSKKVVELLLESGANPNLANAEGSTPLHIICQRNDDDDDELAEIFFKKCDEGDQRVKIDARDKKGRTPLHVALSNSHHRLTKLLLRSGADPDSADKEGLTALHFISQREHDDDFAQIFFEIIDDTQQTVKIDALDNLGRTPLHLAVMNKHKMLTKLLVRRGSDPNKPDAKGFTPLHISVSDFFYGKLHVGGVSMAKILFEICEDTHQTLRIDAWNRDGRTPLQLAVSSDCKGAIKLLLKNSDDPNTVNADGCTPLHMICQRYEDDDTIETFFKIFDDKQEQVKIDAKDKYDRTPLQFAVRNFMPHTVDVLLDRGADLSSFVFPDEGCFGMRLTPDDGFWEDSNLKRASASLAVVERLEKGGYTLNRDDALEIIKFFADCQMFREPKDFNEYWYDDEEFAIDAKETLIIPNLSLYDFIQLRQEEKEKRLTYTDYLEFANGEKLWVYLGGPDKACEVHLCEVLTRQFLKRWSLEYFLTLTQYRLPILCCEMIVEQLRNEDLCNVCLATTVTSS